jgi:hypothetical protein
MLTFAPTHRHLKSGGLYRVITRGHMEADYPATAVVVYDDAEGRVFVRPAGEFDDGRFEPVNDLSPDAGKMVPDHILVERAAEDMIALWYGAKNSPDYGARDSGDIEVLRDAGDKLADILGTLRAQVESLTAERDAALLQAHGRGQALLAGMQAERDAALAGAVRVKPASIDPSHAARLHRLLSILRRLKWTQSDGMTLKPSGPADALNDLGLFMLGHEIDIAIERKDQPAPVEVVPRSVGNLLAVIHGDGGHYQDAHGLEKAAADAITVVHQLRQEIAERPVAVVPAGYRLLPETLTDEMNEAAWAGSGVQWCDVAGQEVERIYSLAIAYSDAVAAAPPAPLLTEAQAGAKALRAHADAIEARYGIGHAAVTLARAEADRLEGKQ